MKNKNQIKINIGEIKNQCFVIMPFDGLFKSQYEKVIKPAIEASGLKCIRGDEIFSKPQIMADIWTSIRESRVVLAELTGKNPNVFYELGIAHAIGKTGIILTRNEHDVPFDLKALRYLYYDPNDPFWGDNLKLAITDLLKKLLSETDFGKVFEDIEGVDELNLPDIPLGRFKSRTKTVKYNISGIWKMNWTHKTSGDEMVSHHATLSLNQDKDKITGEMTSSVPYKGDITVVHQMLIGNALKSEVNLQGVSYSFIKKGFAYTYALDQMIIHEILETRMRGIIKSNFKRNPIKVEFEKIEEKTIPNK